MSNFEVSALVLHRSRLLSADIAAITLLFYENLLTLQLEVTYVWSTKWTFVKILYLIIRYIPFISLSGILVLHSRELTEQDCLAVTRTYAIMLTFCADIAEIILTLRTWAICGRGLKMGIVFVAFFLFKMMIAYIVEGIWWNSLHYIMLPAGIGYNSGYCILIKASKIIWVCWTSVVIFETAVIFLLAIQAAGAYKSGGVTGLSETVYRDGLMYYVYLMAAFIGAVVSIVLLPPDMVRFLSGPAHAIHMSLTARVILHARKQADTPDIHEIPTSFFTQSY